MTLYPNFNSHTASEKIVEDGTTYIIQHGHGMMLIRRKLLSE